MVGSVDASERIAAVFPTGGASLIRLGEKVAPRASESFFQAHDGIDGGILSSGFDVLNKPTTQICFLGQAFLGQFGGGAKPTDILTKNNMRQSVHLSEHAETRKSESDLQIAFSFEKAPKQS